MNNERDVLIVQSLKCNKAFSRRQSRIDRYAYVDIAFERIRDEGLFGSDDVSVLIKQQLARILNHNAHVEFVFKTGRKVLIEHAVSENDILIAPYEIFADTECGIKERRMYIRDVDRLASVVDVIVRCDNDILKFKCFESYQRFAFKDP